MGRPAGAGGDTRRRILDAALDLFSEHGYHATSMRDLARAVGVRESALYHYFPSKERLVEAVVQEVNRESREEAAEQLQMLKDVSLTQLLEGIAEQSLLRLRDPRMRRLLRMARSFGTQELMGLRIWPTLMQMRQQTIARWNLLIDALKADGRIRRDTIPDVFWYQLSAPLFFVSGSFFEHLAMPPAELKRFVRGHVAALVRAFGTEHAEQTAAAAVPPAKLNERSIGLRRRRPGGRR
jgi:AcrR family transcriptional regulator